MGSNTGPVKRPPTASKRSSLQSPPELPIYLPRYWPTDWAASLCHRPARTFQTTLQNRLIGPSAANPAPGPHVQPVHERKFQIGIASCRERECTLAYHRVVAVSLQKNSIHVTLTSRLSIP